MSFYTLAIYFWCAIAALGLTAPFVTLAVQFATDAVSSWLSSFNDDEPVISSHEPLSVP